MTQTVSKPISVIARCEFKANSYVLWGIQSGEKTYEVTCVNHTVTGCRERNGEACKGYKFSGHCKHGDLVQVLEWEHQGEPECKAERPIDELAMAQERKVSRTCLSCGRTYTCWASPDEPDGFCSEKCMLALNALYGQSAEIKAAQRPLDERGSLNHTARGFQLMR